MQTITNRNYSKTRDYGNDRMGGELIKQWKKSVFIRRKKNEKRFIRL